MEGGKQKAEYRSADCFFQISQTEIHLFFSYKNALLCDHIFDFTSAETFLQCAIEV